LLKKRFRASPSPSLSLLGRVILNRGAGVFSCRGSRGVPYLFFKSPNHGG
jgi:hypothetical protein